MTKSEVQLIYSLINSEGPNENFLKVFRGGVSRRGLAKKLLDEAIQSRDSVEIECALIVGFSFGFDEDCLNDLLILLKMDEHRSHENVVMALDDFSSSDAINELYHMTQWTPEYLKYDEDRALATKAIWALGKIPDPRVDVLLQTLATSSENPILRETAEIQIEIRRTGV